MKRRRAIYGALALALGAVIALAGFEAFLRLGARGYMRLVRTPPLTFQGANALKVLCVGDSFTFGIGADGPESYPDRVQAKLARAHAPRPVEVINWGLPAQNSSEALLALRSFFSSANISPDFVCVAIGVNDYWNHHLAAALAGENDAAALDRALFGIRSYRFLKIALARGPVRAGKFYAQPDAADADDKRLLAANERWSLEISKALAANLSAIIKTIREGGSTPLLIGYPEGGAVVSAAYEKAVLETGVSFVSTTGYGVAAQKRVAYRSGDGWHPNALGYDFVATRVFEKLISLQPPDNQ